MRAIDLLFVDDHVVLANKPSGLSVHRGWDRDDDVALFRVRDALGDRVSPVHRLDRGTSGVLLFARTPEAASALGQEFAAGGITKTYLALTRGMVPPSMEIDYPIPKSEGGVRVPAKTSCRLVAHSPVDRCSLVVAIPHTGRLHQIRRHLRHMNHPLIGDVTHGSGVINRHYRATYGLHRLALHALSLTFKHPATGVCLTIKAPVPADLAEPLTRLGLPIDQELASTAGA